MKILKNKKSEISKTKHFNEQKLYWHLLGLLKEGTDTRKEGLSWIIKEIFKMEKKVLRGYLPKFLDDNSIKFIFSRAKIKMKLEELDEKIEKLKNELISEGVLNNFNEKKKIFNEKNYFSTKTNFVKNNNNDNKYFTLSKTDGENNHKIKLKISTTNPKINLMLKNDNTNEEEKKIYSYRHISNSNKNFCASNDLQTINNDDVKAKKTKILKSHRSTSIESNNISSLKEDSSAYVTNKNFYPEKNSNEFGYLTQNNIISSKLKLSDVEKLIEKNQKNNKHIPKDKLSLYQSLINEKRILENQQKEKKKNEMDRIFNEYLKNDYYGRFGVEKNVVLSALIGGDNVLPMIRKQIKQAKKYFESLRSCSMNPNINTKMIIEQLENEKIKKIIGE